MRAQLGRERGGLVLPEDGLARFWGFWSDLQSVAPSFHASSENQDLRPEDWLDLEFGPVVSNG